MTYEKEADELAMAGHLQEQMNVAGVAVARAALAPQKNDAFDGVHCVEEDCGEVLPQIRIVMGRVRCTPCQVLIEAEQKRRGR